MPCVASGQMKGATCTFIDVDVVAHIKHLSDMKIWGYGLQVNDSVGQ